MTNTAISLRQIPLEQLVRSPYQPRQQFDPEKLNELAEAIKTTNGLLQPIVVRPLAHNQYEIIAGERRWRAAMLAGLDTISCLIRPFNDQETLEAAIIENVSRLDLNPIEEAKAYQRLMDEFGYIHEEIGMVVGKSRTKITNSLRMLKLDSRVQQFLIDGALSEGHGKIIVGLPLHLQFDAARAAIRNGWSVRRIEQEARDILNPTKKPQTKDINIKALEQSLAEHIGCQVKIQFKDNRGKLEINFNNLDVLQGVFKKMEFDASL